MVSSHPVVQGVVRLAAEATRGVDRVVVCERMADVAAALSVEPTNVVVIETEGPATTELDTVRAVRELGPGVRIVVLSRRTDGHQVLAAMRLGADAFLPIPDGLRDLAETLQRVLAGERVMAPDLEAAAVAQLGRVARQAREGSEIERAITSRELEILPLLADGLTTQQIGTRLGISPRTVETHVAKLYRKLGVHSRLQAVARAATLGLIDLR